MKGKGFSIKSLIPWFEAANGKKTVPHKAEVGVAGNTGYWGYSKSGEYLSKLDSAAGRTIFDKMRRSDHQVKAVLGAITLPIRQADYYMEPGSEEKQDVEIAKTLEKALLEEMTITWDDTVRHALLMLPFGFSALEKVYEYRGGLILPRKLDPRLPQSVVGWKFDRKKHRLTHMAQRDIDGKKIEIPIEKLLVFTTEKEGDNWEGCSILRSAYKGWYIKDTLEKINSIMHDRWGAGIPDMTVPKNVERGSDAWNQAVKLAEDIHANEKGYIVKNEGWLVDILGGKGEGKGTDVLGSIKYYDEAIATAMLAMFISLGTSKSGNRALGQTFFDAFLMSIQAWADYIAEVINRFCVRELVDLNWEVENYPTFKVKRVQSLALEAIGYLVQTGALKWSEVLENDLRGMLRMPKRDSEETIQEEEDAVSESS
ncbi:MAG TPA: hypothetical protein VMX75_10075 [Spirochaetia bacterium]|nr:hypothetical protein [Spirochaetia bacterium]